MSAVTKTQEGDIVCFLLYAGVSCKLCIVCSISTEAKELVTERGKERVSKEEEIEHSVMKRIKGKVEQED